MSDSDIQAVEQELKQKESEKEQSIAAKVRKELEQEQLMKKLAEEKAALEAKLKAQEESLAAAKKEQEEALAALVERRVAEETAKRKAIVPHINQNQVPKPGLNVSPQDIPSIEAESFAAFMRRNKR